MRTLTITVDDAVFKKLEREAAQLGEPDIALYARDALRLWAAKTRGNSAPTFQAMPISDVPVCDLDLSGVYGIKVKPGEQYYIGSSKCMARRLRSHFRHLEEGRHYNDKLQAAWDWYGKDAFLAAVIDYMPNATIAELRDREYEWIRRYEELIQPMPLLNLKFRHLARKGGV